MKRLHLLFITLGLITGTIVGLIVVSALAESQEIAASVRVDGHRPSWLGLHDGAELQTRSGSNSPMDVGLSLVAADFDEDGVPDLVVGGGNSNGGVLRLLRGNVDALYPNTPEAKERKARGIYEDASFLATTVEVSFPDSPDFLGAGDFDADGHWDLVTAAHNANSLFIFRGDGQGRFAKPRHVALPGGVTAFATGDVNRRDGLTDVIIATQSNDGARLLVFEHANGAFRDAPEIFVLPTSATSIATGQLDEGYEMDLAVSAGSQLILIHGRDRRTSLDADSRAEVSSASVKRINFGNQIVSISIGDFTGDFHEEIAVLSEDSTLSVIARDTETPIAGITQDDQARTWRANDLATLTLPAVAQTNPAQRQLVKAKVSSLPKHDLVIVDGDNQQLQIITSEPSATQAEVDGPVGLSDRRLLAASVNVSGQPTAVFPLRLNSSALQSLVLLRNGGSAPIILSPQAGATMTVNSNLVTNTRDTVLTISEAIRVANGTLLVSALTAEEQAQISGAPANPGLDTIRFNIPGTGIPTITDNFQIPLITDALTIDGATQPAGKVAIESNTGQQTVLHVSAGNSTVRGLVLNRGCRGIHLVTNGNNIIEGNFIGTNTAGTAAGPGNPCGQIQIEDSSNNTIGGTTAAARNIVSGGFTNSSAAINLIGPNTTGNLIRGNYIGPDVTGNAIIGNRTHGVVICSTGCTNNTIGGATAGAGNVISGNGTPASGHSEIHISSAGQLVQGNLIGTNQDGTAPLSGSSAGITINSVANITIGGTTPAARNIISGNGTEGVASHGIVLAPFNSSNCLIQGNYIGTNVTGTSAIRNAGHGVLIVGTKNNTVGGVVAGARNLISGNILDGVSIQRLAQGEPTDNRVQGSFIGTDVTGTLAVANQSDGVEIGDGIGGIAGINLLIGGTTPEARNLISGNRENGIRLRGDARLNPNNIQGNYIGTNVFGNGALGNGQHGILMLLNITDGQQIENNTIAFNIGDGIASESGRPVGGAILSNSIFSNGGLGIDRADNGPTANVNTSTENAPVLTSANTSGNTTTINGTLQQNHTSSVIYTVRFFSNVSCDPSGFGEGRTYIGQTTVNVTNNQPVNFTANISPAVPGGRYITAIASGPLSSTPSGSHLVNSEFSFCRQTAGSAPPDQTTLRAFVIAPDRGGDTGSVTATVTGEGIRQGATLLLRKSGEPDIAGTSIVVDPSGGSIKAAFNLSGSARGQWDVVLTNPDNNSVALPSAFTVEAGRAAALWLDYIGPEILRLNRDTRTFFLYGNSGNVDAEPSHFQITLPREVRLTYAQDQQGVSDTPVGLSKPLIDGGDGTTTVTLFDPNLPSDSSRAFALRVKATELTNDRAINVDLWGTASAGLRDNMNPPLDRNISISSQLLENTSDHFKMRVFVNDGATTLGSVDYTLHVADAAAEAPSVATITRQNGAIRYNMSAAFSHGSLKAYTLEVVFANDSVVQALSPLDSGENLKDALDACEELNAANQDALTKLETVDYLVTNNLLNNSEEAIRYTEAAQVAKAGKIAVDKLPAGPTAGPGMELLSGVMDTGTERAIFKDFQANPDPYIRFLNLTLQDGYINNPKELMKRIEEKMLRDPVYRNRKRTYSRASSDPNDKIGALGNGTIEHWVTTAEPLRYQIRFENQPTATLPAQEVLVTDQLDLTKFDLDTFELGPIAFGVNTLVTPPPGLYEWTTDVDLRPSNNLIVRISAALDKNTGVITWRFLSLDPATGLPTQNAAAGFLPPNVNAPEGDGVVFFTVRAKSGLTAGTQIRNRARIVFDDNAPIDTPEWLNTIDDSRPSSHVNALAPMQTSTTFPVSWAGMDTGSGISNYTIYFSENNGPFTVWQPSIPDATSMFAGQPGKTYGFYAIATDGAANRELPKSVAEAITETPMAQPSPSPTPSPSASPSPSPTLNTVQFSQANYTVTEGVTFASISVTRLGTTTGSATVDIATSDAGALQRTDYTFAFGTLNFAAGETSKNFSVLVSEDAYIESAETLNLTLSNPSGGVTLGTPSTATLTLIDNDSGNPSTNPIDDANIFVRQHYHDFLAREGDAGGVSYWTNQILMCGTDPVCIKNRRLAVSDAFFFENEWQTTGGFILAVHKAALGNFPLYTDYMLDRARVVDMGNLAVSKGNFLNLFVQRPAFTSVFPSSLTPTQYVDMLNANVSNSLTAGERDALITGLANGSKTRASVLGEIADNSVFREAQYNRTFVLSLYFHYLRRDPDQSGFDFWLGKINEFPPHSGAGQHSVVCAFITSTEYQQRFGSVVTRSNAECGP